MRLSEAIRLGGTLHPQGRNQLFLTETHSFLGLGGYPLFDRELLVATCALGGALEAIGISELSEEEDGAGGFFHSIDGVPQDWIALLDTLAVEIVDATLPFTPTLEATIEEVIEFLNDSDSLHWTREQIADWVEGIEKRFYPQLTSALVSDALEQDAPTAALAAA